MSSQKQKRYTLYPIKETDLIPSHMNVTVSDTDITFKHETNPQCHLTFLLKSFRSRINEMLGLVKAKITKFPEYPNKFEGELNKNTVFCLSRCSEKQFFLLSLYQKTLKSKIEFSIFLEPNQMKEFVKLIN